MGKLNCFEIILDHPMAVYLAGATITGRVIVDLNEPMKMRGDDFLQFAKLFITFQTLNQYILFSQTLNCYSFYFMAKYFFSNRFCPVVIYQG